MKIALDVMGGDNAPDINMDGALSLIHISEPTRPY